MNTKDNTSKEIDVLFLLKKLWTKKFLIVFTALFFGTLSLIASIFLVDPAYTATTRVYVVGQSSESVTTQDLQAGSYLVKDYQEIIKSSEVLSKVIAKEESPLSTDELSGMISVIVPTDTRVISISVESKDPNEAAQLTNSVREVAAEKIKEVTKVQDVTTLEEAQVPENPSSPNIKRNIMIGTLAGAFIAMLGVLLTEVLDDRVKRAEDVEEVLGMTLLGVVPNTDKL